MEYKNLEIWFVTGAQLLYGGDAVVAVDAHSTEMVKGLNASGKLPLRVVYKGTVNSSAEVETTLKSANNDPHCGGVITWMHTFSPAKMWIKGLQNYNKPLLHLHTQFNRQIPWSDIDMDFMNLNQSAHGDREFGHIVSRMRRNRKVVVGHWSDPKVQDKLSVWMRVCAAWADAQDMVLVRFGDNMNHVAVTDGDRLEAEIRLGYHVDYYGIGEIAEVQKSVTEAEIDALVDEYHQQYTVIAGAKGSKEYLQVRHAARIELALRRFLKEKGAKAFTTNFNALHDLDQLPGLACQRLMAEGYGFGAEGDWKTAALMRTMWVMAKGLPGGTSFLEDYTYHFDGEKSAILQAHMLEVSPEITTQKPRLEVHPLGIGGKADPARLVFTAHAGAGVAATIVDMGNRFRMIVNNVDVIEPEHALPKLPVASALWIPQPNLEIGAAAWILAGGTHHTAFSYALTNEYMEDYADMAGIELLTIDKSTTLNDFKFQLKVNEVYYK
jgi:L-arabinose isomerase